MIKNLPKDLIDAVGGVLDESVAKREAQYRSLVKAALVRFRVKSFSQLDESGQRIFSEWVTSRLDEEMSCDTSCDSDYAKNKLKTDAHSGLPELGESDSADKDEDELTEEDEKEPAEDEKALDEVYGDEDEKEVKEEDEKDDTAGLTTEEDEKDDTAELTELATSPALGARHGDEQPKHCDVLKDTDALRGEDCYRLLVQYVNSRPEILPPLELPGAPSLGALADLVAGYPDYNGVIGKAIMDAQSLPFQQPQFRGNDKDTKV